MHQTNYQLFDFLDFDQKMTGSECLWKTCAPVSVKAEDGDVVFELPFQKQKVANRNNFV